LSRETEFRVWDNYGNTMHYNVESVIYEDPDEIIPFHKILELASYEVMQYTGLIDKNSKKIYETDIVLFNKNQYYIKYEIGSFMLVRCSDKIDMYKEFENCWNDDVYPLSQLYWEKDCEENYISEIEVIGNTYENEYLVEQS